MEATIFLLILIIIILSIWFFPVFRQFQRQRVANQPFPEHWIIILENYVPLYSRLPDYIKEKLHRHINVFLKEKQFIGCNGLVVTEEIKLIVAALACLLLLNNREEYYPKLASILIYPSPFAVKTLRTLGEFLIEEIQQVRLGESWSRGMVVLAWDQIQNDLKNWHLGHNVILHEFAHQLDQEDGITNGVPILKNQSDYHRWAEVFTEEYKQLIRDIEWGLPTVIDPYGATEPGEFFAVVTEAFFTNPQLMKRGHPKLYDELHRYYQLDPCEWDYKLH